MKKVLITGKNSFIGKSTETWLTNHAEKYSVTTVDVKSNSWKNMDFSKFDTVFHVAGISHVPYSDKDKDLYFKVNRDLTIAVAKKAKADGVGQFIFMSSIIVYGNQRKSNGLITKDSKTLPENSYGMSKLQAEEELQKLANETFKVAIIRSPMVYGRYAMGNFRKLVKFAKWIPVFPSYINCRSMIYIENLCELVRLIVEYGDSGIFHPQNREFVITGELIKAIASAHGKKLLMVSAFNPFIRLVSGNSLVKKVFGNLAYDQLMSGYKNGEYRICDFKESIDKTFISNSSKEVNKN